MSITSDDGNDTPTQKFGSNNVNEINGTSYSTFIGNSGDVYYWSGTQWNDAGMNIIGGDGMDGSKGQKGNTGSQGPYGFSIGHFSGPDPFNWNNVPNPQYGPFASSDAFGTNTINGIEYFVFVGSTGQVWKWDFANPNHPHPYFSTTTSWYNTGLNLNGNDGAKGQKGESGGGGGSLTHAELSVSNINMSLAANYQYYVLWDTALFPTLNFYLPADNSNGGTGGTLNPGDIIIVKFVGIMDDMGELVNENISISPELDNSGDALESWIEQWAGDEEAYGLSVRTGTCIVFTRMDGNVWDSAWMIESKYL